MTDEEYRVHFLSAATEAQVAATLHGQQRETDAARRAETIAAWRARWPESTCSDRVAGVLADMESQFGPKSTTP